MDKNGELGFLGGASRFVEIGGGATLAIGFVLAILGWAVFAYLGVVHQEIQHTIRAREASWQKENAETVARDLKNNLMQVRRNLTWLSAQPTEALTSRTLKRFDLPEDGTGYLAYDPHGMLYATSPSVHESFWLEWARLSGQIRDLGGDVSGVVLGGRWLMLTMPHQRRRGAFVASLMDLREWEDHLRAKPLPEGAEVWIVRADGIVLASSVTGWAGKVLVEPGRTRNLGLVRSAARFAHESTTAPHQTEPLKMGNGGSSRVAVFCLQRGDGAAGLVLRDLFHARSVILLLGMALSAVVTVLLGSLLFRFGREKRLRRELYQDNQDLRSMARQTRIPSLDTDPNSALILRMDPRVEAILGPVKGMSFLEVCGERRGVIRNVMEEVKRGRAVPPMLISLGEEQVSLCPHWVELPGGGCFVRWSVWEVDAIRRIQHREVARGRLKSAGTMVSWLLNKNTELPDQKRLSRFKRLSDGASSAAGTRIRDMVEVAAVLEGAEDILDPSGPGDSALCTSVGSEDLLFVLSGMLSQVKHRDPRLRVWSWGHKAIVEIFVRGEREGDDLSHHRNIIAAVHGSLSILERGGMVVYRLEVPLSLSASSGPVHWPHEEARTRVH